MTTQQIFFDLEGEGEEKATDEQTEKDEILDEIFHGLS